LLEGNALAAAVQALPIPTTTSTNGRESEVLLATGTDDIRLTPGLTPAANISADLSG
jgi:hypothetical protein